MIAEPMSTATCEVDLIRLVDCVVADLLAHNVPPSPKNISGVLAEIFCAGFGDADYQEYHAQLEALVRERVRIALAPEEKLDLMVS
jgi:hypothetical protein